MARKPYKVDQSIHSMTTRQLRQYIADKAEEAQKRLDSAVGEDTTKAFREAAWEIQGRGGKVKRSTSNMSKEEMREFAYALRQFNSLDTTSGFAKSVEWKENKSKYETFIRNRIADGDSYWEKFLTAKGNVSKRGYQEYKDYVDFVKGIQEYKSQFGYRTLLQYAESAMEFSKGKDLKDINKLLSEVWEESKGKGFSQAKLIESFELRLNELNAEEAKQRSKAVKSAVKAYKGKKSKSNIKVKKGRQMKGGKVRERLT